VTTNIFIIGFAAAIPKEACQWIKGAGDEGLSKYI
jgi:hypothetical protein